MRRRIARSSSLGRPATWTLAVLVLLVIACDLIVVAACDRSKGVTSCDDSLQGVWQTPAGARWMMLDYGATLEAYPMFDDGIPEGAPRVIDLARGAKISGDVKRRYTHGEYECEARAPIRIGKCKDNGLQVVLGDPLAPAEFNPCAWGHPSQTRVEWWKRP